jgi:hypothetical protein
MKIEKNSFKNQSMPLYHIGPYVCPFTSHEEMHNKFPIGHPICPFYYHHLSYQLCFLKP